MEYKKRYIATIELRAVIFVDAQDDFILENFNAKKLCKKLCKKIDKKLYKKRPSSEYYHYPEIKSLIKNQFGELETEQII